MRPRSARAFAAALTRKTPLPQLVFNMVRETGDQ